MLLKLKKIFLKLINRLNIFFVFKYYLKFIQIIYIKIK